MLDRLRSHGSCHPLRAAAPRHEPVGSSCRQLTKVVHDANGPPPSLHGHYPASSLLRGSPPLLGVSVLSASRVFRLCLFPCHRRTGSQVPHQSQDQSHATCTPDTAWPVTRFPPCSSRRTCRSPVLMSSVDAISRPHQGFTCVRLSGPTHDVIPSRLFRNVHHLRHWATAAYGCLKPAPESRLRRTSFISGTAWRAPKEARSS